MHGVECICNSNMIRINFLFVKCSRVPASETGLALAEEDERLIESFLTRECGEKASVIHAWEESPPLLGLPLVVDAGRGASSAGA